MVLFHGKMLVHQRVEVFLAGELDPGHVAVAGEAL